MEILRGDVFYVKSFGDSHGSEQKGDRPAVVVSNNMGNINSSFVQVVYLTTAEKKPLPTHCKVMCLLPSIALCEQVTSVTKERLVGYIKSCTDEEMDAIDKCLKISLALDDIETTREDESKVAIERDLYKKLYEDMLGRLLK